MTSITHVYSGLKGLSFDVIRAYDIGYTFDRAVKPALKDICSENSLDRMGSFDMYAWTYVIGIYAMVGAW